MIFFGSEIWAKRDFFQSMKDARNFLDYQKYKRGVFWVAKKVLLKIFF